MYDRNITIANEPGSDIWRQEMFKLPYPYPELAEKFFYITSSYDELFNITKYQLLAKESYLHCLQSRLLKWLTLTYPFSHLHNITGITCSNSRRIVWVWLWVGKRGRHSLVQIQRNSSRHSSFRGSWIPQQQEVAPEWGKYTYGFITLLPKNFENSVLKPF